ncbi:MAG: 3-hydroxyacyl-CoA dehydrogenase/enoyl-CoA hydratase family protein [Candidatus Bipolaricaulia bacterium]
MDVNIDDVRHVAVIGAGTMGHGIAELAALAGYDVTLHDIDDDIVQNGHQQIDWSLQKLAEKGFIKSDDAQAAIQRVATTTEIPRAAEGADVVIEAGPEKMAVKHDIFKQLDENAPDHAVLASNTSSLSISEIAEATDRPSQVAGMHFFNPPVKMDLVEAIKGKHTSDDTLELITQLAERLGKSPVKVHKDVFGFIVNRVLVGPFMFEPAWMVSRGETTIEAIDARMKFFEGFPMGPFELQDLTGIDIGYYLSREAGLPIPPIVEDKVQSNELGRKTGQGFYNYENGGADYAQEAGEPVDPTPVYALMVNEATSLLEQGVTTAAEIDKAVQLGAGFPEGLLQRADDIGLDTLLDTLKSLHDEHGDERYRPTSYLETMVQRGHTGRDAGQGFYSHGDAGGTDLSGFQTIDVQIDDRIARITLDREHRLNAINARMREELPQAFQSLEMRDDVRAIVIQGAGDRAFSAGADITEFASGKPHQLAEIGEFFDAPAKCAKPVVAAIDGYALGGGLELSLACDFRLASQRSEVGQPEINLGLIPGGGGTQRLARLIGPSRAKELIMLGERVSADEAEQWGLINHVYPDASFDAQVEAFARKLADGPPIALKFAKRVVDEGLNAPMETALAMEHQAFGLLFSTEDMVEGTTAFMSKKDPDFQGK